MADYNNRRCGEDYRIVVLKSVEVERVIDYAEHLDYDMRPTTTAGVEKIVAL